MFIQKINQHLTENSLYTDGDIYTFQDEIIIQTEYTYTIRP